jgi:hypothetical protein
MQGPFDFGAGFLYVTDYFNHRVVRMNDITGAGWTTLGTQGSGVMQFNLPTETLERINDYSIRFAQYVEKRKALRPSLSPRR